MSESVTASVTVPGANGLHLVPCSLIAQKVAGFDCSVRISKGELTVDGRNIFELMSLSAGEGTELMLTATGDSASMAIDSLVELFQSGFNGHAFRPAE